MRKQEINNIIEKYLKIFPSEQEKQKELINFVNNTDDLKLTDWNNFSGHIVASAFIYGEKEKKFLVLFHKDLKMYLYPGGHIEENDKSVLDAAKREVIEETGITNFKVLLLHSMIIPVDISYHQTPYNSRLNLPSHPHYDFRYLFTIENIIDVKTDTLELGDYKWITMDELEKDSHFGNIASKIKDILKENKINY